MDIEIIFKIAAIGIITSVVCQVLSRAGREDIATLAALSGLVIVLMLSLIHILSSGSITMSNAIVCTLCSLVLGLIVACVS